MARKPKEPKRDPLEAEIDALLKELPEADPKLEGDPEVPAAGGVAVAESNEQGASVAWDLVRLSVWRLLSGRT